MRYAKFITLLLTLFVQQIKAQDPELLMNESRIPLLHYQKAFSSTDAKSYASYGVSTGLTISFGNLFFSKFSSKRFRMGDLFGADVGLGYTESKTTYNIMLWGRAELGLQAYYGLHENLDAGLKVYSMLNADPVNGGSISGLTFQPLLRYKSFITECSAVSDKSRHYKHFQCQLKYIFDKEEHYKGVVLRYERFHGDLLDKADYLSLGLSVNFASNR